jgi:hypothetical protein
MSTPHRPRRRLRSDLGVVALVTAMFVALLVAVGVWAVDGSDGGGSVARAAAGTGTKQTATLRILRPGGEVKRAGGSAFRAANDGQALRQGDTVRSDPTGLLELDYADGSLTRIGPSAEFTIEVLTAERGGRQTRGGLTVGETWSRAAKVSETGSFEVRSGGTTAAVEGTAFAFSCNGAESARVCTVIDVVDHVVVTTDGGAQTRLTPATGVMATNDVLGTPRQYTREELAANPFVMENLVLDQAAGKGLGNGDLPASVIPPSSPPVVTDQSTTTPEITTEAAAPDESTDESGTTPEPPPPPPPPPSDPRCVDGGWTQLVGAGGQTFPDEQACSDFALAGGQFAVAGGGVFIVPRGSVVTLDATSDGACNTLEFGYSVQLDESTTTAATVGTVRQGLPCGGSLGSGVLPTFDTAVLLRVFLQDDSCATTRFASDGDHAAQTTPTNVAIMDAGGNCSAESSPRPPVLDAPVRNFDLYVTVSIGPPPAG